MDFLSLLFPDPHRHHGASFVKQMFLFLLLVVIPVSTSSQFWHQSADRSALLSFKSHIEKDPLGALASWNQSLHHCRWHGITCSHRHRERVTVLDLPSQGLEGTVSPYIGNLTFLRRINLAENYFHGEIPQEIGRLFRLQYLNLNDNLLSGEISIDISSLSKLELLVLSFNKLAGVIPSSLGDLSALTALSLLENQLVESIPDSLCRIRSLEVFQVGQNKLSGELPSCLYNLPNITFFGVFRNQLQGSLPPNLLPNIQRLYLHYNNFHGQIPVSLFSARNLEELDLRSNSFSGEIPNNFTGSRNLTFLNLSRNKLTGKIPAQLSSLLKLDQLFLENNHLTGNIPSFLGNLSSLTQLSLLDNHLEGSLPGELCGLQNSLSYFVVDFNNLTGEVPSCFYNSSSMEAFSVAFNQLEGHIPPHLSSTLPNIQQIWISTNKFTGPLPISFSNSTKLEVLVFNGNNFIGSVPRDLGRLPRLRLLDIGYNRLVENDLEFISDLTNCSYLEVLGVAGNHLKGALPESISNMSTHLKRFLADSNRIYGTIPTGFGNLVNLEAITLENNNLTGSIPKTIGNLYNLENLNLENNMLSGELPASLGNMTKLSSLYFASNEFIGHIPRDLGNCKSLLTLSLSRNRLTSTIPNHFTSLPSIVYLYLDNNFLTGSLPSDIGNLTKLVELSVSGNKLSGKLPNSLGSCISLEKLLVENNIFEGEIPKSLSSLKGLIYFDLSRNHFSGEIPKYLEHLHNLVYLNLSFNQLVGEVPHTGVFGNTSSTSVVGNKDLCGGQEKLKLHLCMQKTKKKTVSLKVILPIIVGTLCVLAFLCLLLTSYRKKLVKRKSFSSTTLFNEYDKRVSYSELFKATNGFSMENLIGVGSYGSVFKGTLQVINKIVAVKVFKLQREGASKSFLTECNALRNIRHRNLLKVITVCSSVDFQGNDFKALVFDFMPNGSLEDWLHRRLEETQVYSSILNFIQRLNIALDVAFALEYLHHRCHQGIAHCDLKPSNVLLDNDMIACVADFGIAKIFPITSSSFVQGQTNSVAIKGTIGYVAPEYGMGSAITTQGDVYSFGILLLEIFTRKKPTDEMFLNGLSLHNYAKMSLPNQVMEIIDAILLVENNEFLSTGGQNTSRDALHECLVLIIKLGVTCSVESPME